jgi:hypothetical protein
MTQPLLLGAFSLTDLQTCVQINEAFDLLHAGKTLRTVLSFE